MKRFALQILCAVIVLAPVCVAQQVIPLYAGPAPGTPSETYPQKEYFSQTWKTNVVTNVTRLTLTVFKPTGGTNSGSAIVICPGGGFVALSIESEGRDVARYLAARGMTAFILSYRLAPTAADPTQAPASLTPQQKKSREAAVQIDRPIAIDDGLAAMAYVRQHAAEFSVSPDRVGIIGFSAGGRVASGVAFEYKPESRPAFVAAIYPGRGDFNTVTVPDDAPPMFIAAATDDNLGLAPVSIALYQKWTAAGKSAELHMYAKGRHGFGMHQQNIPTDHWIDRFAEWLELEGFLKK